MPLSKNDLKDKFVKVLKDVEDGVIKIDTPPNTAPVPPLMSQKLADELAKAYHDWAKGAKAGTMDPSGGVAATIAAALVLTPLFNGWGPGTNAYWTAVTWKDTAGTFTGVTIGASMMKVSADLLAQIFTPPFPNNSSPKTKEEFSDKLATILDTNTKAIKITMTNTTSGATSTVSPT